MPIGKDWYEKVSKKIRKAMEHEGVSEKQLSEMTGLDEVKIEMLLTGNFSNLTLSDIETVSTALHIDPNIVLRD